MERCFVDRLLYGILFIALTMSNRKNDKKMFRCIFTIFFFYLRSLLLDFFNFICFYRV